MEDSRYTSEHHDPAVLSCANAIEIELKSGETSPRMETRFPIGDSSRRAEGESLLLQKFTELSSSRWSNERRAFILEALLNTDNANQINIREFMDQLVLG